jgi:50S ribosomal protein L16 3-hydroxylase
VDLHLRAARALLDAFRFVPDVRLDDLMVSWASDGGGVGPHLDSYDVFLLQLQGRRRWRIGPAADRSFRAGLPLKILRRFEPDEEWLLEPGDMLYLPPGHAHDGVAVGGGCLTASIGFRAPDDATLAGEVLQRLADPDDEGVLYADPRQPATRKPGAIPDGLTYFATRAVLSRMAKGGFERAVGEVLSEPGAQVWFAAGTPLRAGAGVAVAAATRLLYDRRHVFINGESFVASGTDQRLLQKLADKRRLSGQDVARFSDAAREWVGAWHEQGWLTPERPDMTDTPERRP